MVLGRREISAIVLAVGALLFYVVFLLSGQLGAQINNEAVIVNGETIIDDRTIIDDNIQEDVIIEVDRDRKPTRKEPTIINIPRKPLPPSGGPPVYGVVASFILAGTGLLALGIGIRRGLRR